MANAIMSLVATNSPRIRSLPIVDGQLIFIQDLGRIAFDFKGARVFYNQIVELETEAARLTLDEPLSGYYFVIGSGCLWYYDDGWTQITEKPKEVVHIDVELPQLGQAKEGVLYVDKTNNEIKIWDESVSEYQVVADKTEDKFEDQLDNMVDVMSENDIDFLFA